MKIEHQSCHSHLRSVLLHPKENMWWREKCIHGTTVIKWRPPTKTSALELEVIIRTLLLPPHLSLPGCTATQSLVAKISRRRSRGVWSSNMICLLYWGTTLQQAAVAVTWERQGRLSAGNWMWTYWVTFFWQVTHTDSTYVDWIPWL